MSHKDMCQRKKNITKQQNYKNNQLHCLFLLEEAQYSTFFLLYNTINNDRHTLSFPFFLEMLRLLEHEWDLDCSRTTTESCRPRGAPPTSPKRIARTILSKSKEKWCLKKPQEHISNGELEFCLSTLLQNPRLVTSTCGHVSQVSKILLSSKTQPVNTF